ncbi:MAG: NAD-dependent deacetylase, partial [Gaiellales bacterium]
MPDRLAALIRERQPCVVLTGAGISTESGIPDFRSPSGIWATLDPMEYASLSAFRRDPERVWSFYRLRIQMLTEAEPNRAHLALAALERRGLVAGLVTQNIDMLHERAGTQQLVEVHGSIRSATCQTCRATQPLPAVLAQLETSDSAPRCPTCEGLL